MRIVHFNPHHKSFMLVLKELSTLNCWLSVSFYLPMALFLWLRRPRTWSENTDKKKYHICRSCCQSSRTGCPGCLRSWRGHSCGCWRSWHSPEDRGRGPCSPEDHTDHRDRCQDDWCRYCSCTSGRRRSLVHCAHQSSNGISVLNKNFWAMIERNFQFNLW